MTKTKKKNASKLASVRALYVHLWKFVFLVFHRCSMINCVNVSERISCTKAHKMSICNGTSTTVASWIYIFGLTSIAYRMLYMSSRNIFFFFVFIFVLFFISDAVAVAKRHGLLSTILRPRRVSIAFAHIHSSTTGTFATSWNPNKTDKVAIVAYRPSVWSCQYTNQYENI